MRQIVAFFALATLTAGIPAVAQDTQIGSRLAPRQTADLGRGGPGAIRALHSYATCLVHRREQVVRQFLRATDAKEIGRLNTMLFRDVQCQIPGMSEFADSQRLSTTMDIQRGTLAEAVLDTMRSIPLPPPMPLEHLYTSKWTAVSGRDPLVEEMAVCVAATNPAAIEQLTRSTPETPEEKVAIGVMVGQLGPCLQSNARLTANRPSLRAALAEALFHRIDEPTQAMVAPK